MLTRYRLAAVVLGLLFGLALGLGSYTFLFARGWSYMTNDSAACANCHVMREQFEGWQLSSHRSVAVCNDCHTPHNLIGKYATKARNGFWHSFYFTTGDFPEPISITKRSLEITEGACRHCHEAIVHAIDAGPGAGYQVTCVRCHRNVGHLH